MPISDYDRWHGGNAAKARRKLIERYGRERGERVFWAMTNDRRGKSGSNGMRGVLRGRAKRTR